MEPLHFILDLLGLIPVVGSVFDAINAGLYYSEERYGEAALSLVGVVPLLGEAAVLGKFVKRTVKVVDELAVVKEGAKIADTTTVAARKVTEAELAKCSTTGQLVVRTSDISEAIGAAGKYCPHKGVAAMVGVAKPTRTGVAHFDRLFHEAADYADIKRQIKELGFDVIDDKPLAGPLSRFEAVTDPVERVVHLDPTKSTYLALLHELQHAKQFKKMSEAGFGPEQLKLLSPKEWEYVNRYLEEGTLLFEKELALTHGFDSAYLDELALRFEQQGWTKKYRQHCRFRKDVRSLIERIPFSPADTNRM